MPRRPFTRAMILGITLALTAPAAWAAPHRTPEAASSWSLVAQLWHALTASWIDNGCSVDPDGRCAGETVADEIATREEGCSVDPDGRCAGRTTTHETTTRDEGCSVDPSGWCGR